jgi:hypothetical protein
MSPARRAKKQRPWWVEQRTFVVPYTLHGHIQALPDDIRLNYCYIVSKVVIETKKFPTLYHNISSAYFNDFIGSGYRAYLDRLKEWDILEINDAYLNAGGSGFTKSYRLHPSALAAAKVKIKFKKKQVHPLRDNSKLTDGVIAFVHENLKRLTVRTDLLPQADVIDEVDAEGAAEEIYFQAFNVRYSPKAKRLFHAAILMPKIARKNLVLKSDASVPLFEYDVKSCMPVILLGLIKDPAERATLTALLDGDIYTAIASDCGVTDSRDDIKREFLRFVNGGVHNYVFTFFHAHLPTLAELVLKGKGADKGMAWFGQRVESEIMVQEVPRQLMQMVTAPSSVNQSTLSLTSGGNPDEGILYIPMHDGWLGIERHEQRIADTVRNEFHRRLGYWVTITKTKLATSEETVLANRPLHTGNQVEIH